MMKGKMLHVGCGYQTLPEWANGCEEVRLDIDESVNPDIVASMTDLGDIGGFDYLLSCHSVEHLYPHQVGIALREFRRVLRDGGSAIIFVPDLEDVKATEDVLYESPAGSVCGLDMIYGMRNLVEESPYMEHHTGFTKETIEKALTEAGFTKVIVNRLGLYNLMAVGVK